MATATADNKTAAAIPESKSTEKAFDNLSNLAQNISLATVYGAATGAATKKICREIAYGCGLALIFLQACQHYGFITIHWGQVNKKITQALDQDGDGKFDHKDAKIMAESFLQKMTKGIPDVAGFSAGFYAGVKYF